MNQASARPGGGDAMPALAAREAHLWHIEPAADDVAVAAAWTSVSATERDRALRLRDDGQRSLFLLRRQALRAILAQYVDRPPQSLAFETGPLGKPALAVTAGAPTVSFNLSHSGGTTLLAVARRGALGVDVERLRPVPEWQGIARRLFTVAEARMLDALAERQRQAAFLRLWTRKEAVVKALGGGLSIELDAFGVDLCDPPSRVALHWHGQAHPPADLWLLPVPVLAGHAVALAVDGGVDSCRLLRWTRH